MAKFEKQVDYMFDQVRQLNRAVSNGDITVNELAPVTDGIRSSPIRLSNDPINLDRFNELRGSQEILDKYNRAPSALILAGRGLFAVISDINKSENNKLHVESMRYDGSESIFSVQGYYDYVLSQSVVIGRTAAVDDLLSDDRTLSRRHVSIKALPKENSNPSKFSYDERMALPPIPGFYIANDSTTGHIKVYSR